MINFDKTVQSYIYNNIFLNMIYSQGLKIIDNKYVIYLSSIYDDFVIKEGWLLFVDSWLNGGRSQRLIPVSGYIF